MNMEKLKQLTEDAAEQRKKLVEMAGEDMIETLEQTIIILDCLKKMDVDMLNNFLSMCKLVVGVVPEAMAKGVQVMMTDIALILAFIEQAKAYDQTDNARVSFHELFGHLKGGDK